MAAKIHMPLPRRLVTQILLVGLSCLLVHVILSLIMAWNGSLTTHPVYAIVLPVLILLVGAVCSRKAFSHHAAIEEQLNGLASLSATAELNLQPVHGHGPVVAGWNYMIERFSSTSALSRLERRLSLAQPDASSLGLMDILNQLPDGFAITDSSDRIIQSNRSFEQLVRVSNNPIGSTIEDLLTPLSTEQTQTLIQRMKGSSRSVVFEFTIKDETSITVLRIARHRRSDGNGQIWNVRDISQQKLAESMRNQFVTTATHELRTPLTNIKAYSESLAMYEDIDPEQQKHFFNTIHSEATRLSRFVDELLNVSQMEAGALTLASHETDIGRLIEEVIQKTQPEIDRKRINFEQRLPAKIPRLSVDKDKLSAALVNLVGNAVKYTAEEGKVRLDVELTPTELLIHVEDTGYGIAPEDLEKLFTKFFRSEDDRVRSEPGSGLGLAFTQEVTRLHGGRITVHSELNKGSRFTMTLPRLRLQAAS